MSITLQTSQSTFEELHQLVDGKRNSVKVNPQELLNLLIDHTAMSRKLMAHGYKIELPASRARVRLKAS